jgi:hypothetical protein
LLKLRDKAPGDPLGRPWCGRQARSYFKWRPAGPRRRRLGFRRVKDKVVVPGRIAFIFSIPRAGFTPFGKVKGRSTPLPSPSDNLSRAYVFITAASTAL